MIVITYASFLLAALKANVSHNALGTNETIKRSLDLLGGGVARTAVTCLILTLGMFAFARARRYDKKQAVDTVVTIIFCVFFTAFPQIIIKAFLVKL